MNINAQSAREFIDQGWLEGELRGDVILSEVLQRIGAHIFSDYQEGLLTWEVAEASLQSLNVCEDLWLGMPEIPQS